MQSYHMQKKERKITDKNIVKHILKRGKYVTISLCKMGEPYIITLSYGFDDDQNALYFHSANLGLKLDILKENPNVCGTIIEDLGYSKGTCSHKYRSIVFWGEMIIIKDLEEKKHGFDVLLNHLEENPSKMKKKFFKNENSYLNTCVMRLDIKKVTGKASE
ncbi:MAG: pyridoxamine 5'-phosphate oxidase family protein [Candidatus Lokiarchaeota archaeon]|nr:pyridoxamine 5'-phosphate oxidase family protein [Candidatus Lokiarchaeota archaeon]